MTRGRLHELLDLVWECKKLEEINVTLEAELYGETVYIWKKEQADGIDMVTYKSSDHFPIADETKHNGVRIVNDPGLVKAENHIKRLLGEVKK